MKEKNERKMEKDSQTDEQGRKWNRDKHTKKEIKKIKMIQWLNLRIRNGMSVMPE